MQDLSKLHFVQQQGFEHESDASCAARFPALMFQPRVVGILVLLGLVTQSAALFLLLSAILWWSAFVPRYNPFDLLYNRLIAGPQGTQQLTPAPAPRRFSQGIAASFNLGIGITLAGGWLLAAYILQGLIVIALTALIFGRFCLGSYIYYLIHGKVGFANRTLPWAHF